VYKTTQSQIKVTRDLTVANVPSFVFESVASVVVMYYFASYVPCSLLAGALVWLHGALQAYLLEQRRPRHALRYH